MTERLTKEWTETTDEAFGPSGTKGRQGEEFMAKVFESWGWEYKVHSNDREKQLKGIDIEFRKPTWANFYSCDVKNNMDQYGNFYVHKDWLFKDQCDRIFHVNPNTKWIVWYDTKSMQESYDKMHDYMKFTAKNRLPFMKATKVEFKYDEGVEDNLGHVSA